jgi:vacuolar-type H+-ATPase subunit C/Vma6
MKLREYLEEMTKYSKKQKDELCHNILNTLADPNAARMLRRLKKSADSGNISVSRNEVESILNNLKKIRQIIIDLPLEDE